MLNELHTSLFNSSPIPMWVANRVDLAYLEVNDEALRLYGYSREEFLSMNAFDLRDVSDTKFLVEKTNIFTDFKIQEAVHLKKNRECIIVEVTGQAIHYKGKEAYLVSAIDITERKKVEERLKTSQQLLLASEKIGNIGSYEILLQDLADWRNNPTILSDEAYNIYGYEPESEVSFDRFMRLVHPEDADKIIGSPEGLFQSSQSYQHEYRIVLPDGTLKHIYGNLSVIFDKEKNIPIKLIGVAQDITERKKLEIELDNYNQKLKEEIEKQTLELTNANNNLDAFNYSISHDISTPLRAMDMYVGLLKENLEQDLENIEYVQKLETGINEIKKMISSLLELSKYSKIELRKESIDMGFEIKKSIELFRNDNSNGKVNFNINKTPAILADKVLIKNILSNLIGNAIKYSSKEKNPIIEISGIRDESYTTYSIKDNGDGFDSKFKSKLFKPFSRLHNDSEFEGNGAGLAIVERIMSRHGGSIWAEGEKGKGATFYIQFPNT